MDWEGLQVKAWAVEHPFVLSVAWIIVTCFAWGALLGSAGASWLASLLFGAAWSFASVEFIYWRCDRARSD